MGGDGELGYRQGRPLADIIPPDRRRLKASALVLCGMIAGAFLLAGLENVFAQRTAAAASAPIVRGFVSRPIFAGSPDRSFELVVNGPVKGIVVARCDDRGQPDVMRWVTIDYDPASPERSSYGPPPFGSFQLSVSENGKSLDDGHGALVPLAAGEHRLVLRVTAGNVANEGSRMRAWVIGPSHQATASEIVVLAAPAPSVVPPVMANPPAQEGFGAPSRPFNRAAADSSLGAVKLDPCTKVPGSASAGRIEVTFGQDGRAADARVVDGPMVRSAAGRCVADEFRRQAHVPEFDGPTARATRLFFMPRPTLTAADEALWRQALGETTSNTL